MGMAKIDVPGTPKPLYPYLRVCPYCWAQYKPGKRIVLRFCEARDDTSGRTIGEIVREIPANVCPVCERKHEETQEVNDGRK
jgi:hypothetical protein